MDDVRRARVARYPAGQAWNVATMGGGVVRRVLHVSVVAPSGAVLHSLDLDADRLPEGTRLVFRADCVLRDGAPGATGGPS
jgi:hypothetical protein